MHKKKVIIEITITDMVEVPEDYSEEDINFFYNESCHCIETELEKILDHNENCCNTCWRAKTKYLRDATEGDINTYEGSD